MMSENFMMQYGDRLLAGGFPILPIKPGEKFPGQFQKGQWFPYKGWTKHATRATTGIELSAWKQWPEAGIGIPCGMVAGVDIDIVDDVELSERLQQLAFQILGETPAVRIGQHPKRMLVYRTVAPFKGVKAHPLEILCQGQQFVAYAIHPGTGKPYNWPVQHLADLTLANLPIISEEQARAFIEQGLALLPEGMRPARLAEKPTHPQAVSTCPLLPTGDLHGTCEAIREALRHIVNAELPYDDWVRIGMAIKGALGEDGAGLFADWSAGSSKNVPETTSHTWVSLHPTSIGAGTIYHLAQKNGWKPDAAITLNPANQHPGPHPAAGLLQKIQQLPVASPKENTPAFLDGSDWKVTDLDGVLGMLVEHMVATATRPQPILAVGNALCALGAIMGHRYRTETNLRSNLYIVGIADSGSGKNHSREVINRLFFEANLTRYLGGNKIASGSGLLSALKRHPALLFQQDEFGMFFHAVADRRYGQRYLTEILDLMTELYTSASTLFLGTEYAGVGTKITRQDITQPCLCVYGTTTPYHFWNALQSTNVIDGSLARFLILVTDNDYPEENDDIQVIETPPRLLEALTRVAYGGSVGEGNMCGLTTDGTTAVEPMVVPMEPSARARFKELKREVTAYLRQNRGTPFTSLLSRIGENAAKVALIRGVSFDPVSPIIRESDAIWAIALVRTSVAAIMRMVEEHVADNQVEHNHKRILAIIRESGLEGINKTDLGNRSRFLTRRDRNEILAELVEEEIIQMDQVASAWRKPQTIFRFTGREDQLSTKRK